MESYERATSDFFFAMSSSKGYWYSLLDLDDTSLSFSQLLGVSIEELLDVFENIEFVKKVKKNGSQFNQWTIRKAIEEGSKG